MNEWIIVAAVGVVGGLLFVLRFGPYLLVRWATRTITKSIMAELDELSKGKAQTPYLDAKRNHCRIEGIEWFVHSYLD